MNRVIRLLEEWLPLLADLSGLVVPVYDARLDDVEIPSLQQQLREILNFVALQELRSCSARPGGRAARRRPHPKGQGWAGLSDG
jgi:hypothetical protein